MKVRNADGWVGTIVAMLPIQKRNLMGFIGQVTVKVDDVTEDRTRHYVVGQVLDTPAGNFKPLSSGLKFQCG